MSAIAAAFAKGPAFVGYLTAGDGGIDKTLAAALALVAGGVDILEIGVPFSDPVADGATIQAASTRALSLGTTLDDVLELITQLRSKTTVPIILFSYYNPILAMDAKHFYQRAKDAGVDGCLIVDLPIEEAQLYHAACDAADLDPIFIIAPSTSIERVRLIEKQSRGMLYYVARKGTTGVKDSLPEDFSKKIQAIKSTVSLPIVAGFGIANKAMAAQVLADADGFVVGSLFVKTAHEQHDPAVLTELAQSLDPR